MTTAPATYDLPAVTRMEDCHHLFDFLNAAQDQDVQINCQDVTRLSGLCAQLLTMGAKAWAANDRDFHLCAASQALHDDLKSLGLSDFLTVDGASA
ncbi:MAG: STAS domain-containing protein [Yoonia sp.]|uniref:STAS domain-containing protein n=1 Tax=Yoonia sp. TaxID=2212373 RepID=UPI00273CFF01|nr:STAS domain-containing protein [Yoonia sp.]MDP5085419.1 STAS domain-containing protein [Yoonia sp.]MDP5361022.1 STAS domain-containing protein [Paracoccaceae bacterium]